MAEGSYAEIQEKFGGTWKLDRSENFEDFLREVGVNYFIRKMAGMSKPTSVISVENERVNIALNAGFMTKNDNFSIGEEFDTDHQGNKAKAKALYSGGMIAIESQAVDANVKNTKSTREITGDGEMLLTMYIGDVVCKRWFKKVPT